MQPSYLSNDAAPADRIGDDGGIAADIEQQTRVAPHTHVIRMVQKQIVYRVPDGPSQRAVHKQEILHGQLPYTVMKARGAVVFHDTAAAAIPRTASAQCLR